MKKLLIVEDDASIRAGLSRYLEARGYAVDCAREREEAEALVSWLPYACVIVDLRLAAVHGPDGLHVIACVRDARPGTPVIVMTATTSAEVEAEARRLGARAFFRKPTPLAELAQVVDRLVAGAA
jgi:DNA-binding response OmpR family regulator